MHWRYAMQRPELMYAATDACCTLADGSARVNEAARAEWPGYTVEKPVTEEVEAKPLESRTLACLLRQFQWHSHRLAERLTSCTPLNHLHPQRHARSAQQMAQLPACVRHS